MSIILPVEITLTYDSSNKQYIGTDNGIYARGSLAEGKQINLTVKTIDSTLTDNNSNSYALPYSAGANGGYDATVTNPADSDAEGYNATWNQTNAYVNAQAADGINGYDSDDLVKSTMSVIVDGNSFVPKAAGSFTFPIGVTVGIGDAA